MTTAAEIAYQLDLTESKNGFTGRCPSCQYETGFSVADKNGRTLVHCHAGGCTQQEVIQALREYGLWGNQSATSVEFPVDPPVAHLAPARNCNNYEAALAMWQRAKRAEGTVVETYLRARGFSGSIPPALRYVSAKHRADEAFHPAMLAGAVLLEDPPRFAGVHRTFLREDGLGKARLNPDKMTLGEIRGAGVVLSLPGSRVAVSEGIETGLSVQQATGIPTIAALSAAGMQALLLPMRVQEVFIAADHDNVGLNAAHAAARSWHAQGRVVKIVTPPEEMDFNDLARSGG